MCPALSTHLTSAALGSQRLSKAAVASAAEAISATIAASTAGAVADKKVATTIIFTGFIKPKLRGNRIAAHPSQLP
jgi:hypothetical protein